MIECDMCGMKATSSKRGEIKIHKDGITRCCPQKQLFHLCETHYKTFEPNDCDVNYDECDISITKWFDR